MEKKERELTAIDVFSGAGGLTLGLKRAGFRVAAAIELNEEVMNTYRANHPEVKTLVRDVFHVKGKDLLAYAGLKSVDLIAGCPPCQGFSKLTERYGDEDPRNALVLEMARLTKETLPCAVMMENVPGLVSRGETIFHEFLERLERLGYVVNWRVCQVADYGVPQTRKRLVLLAGRGFEIKIPKGKFVDNPGSVDSKHAWKTMADAIRDLDEPVTLSHAKSMGGPKKFNWHVVRDLKPISKKRLSVMSEGQDRTHLPKRLRPPCHKERKNGFKNVYGRMSWDKPAPTITSGCTTPSKGRFGHPTSLRTISVREAALIQTFPSGYSFETDSIDLVCEMIGNALPPRFAYVMARSCALSLLRHRGQMREERAALTSQ